MKTMKTEIQSNTRTHALTVNKLAIILVSALTLIGCATSNEITLPDGGQGYSIECPTGVSRTACPEKLLIPAQMDTTYLMPFKIRIKD